MNDNTPTYKNIVYGNISAGGDVHIGDIIYQISEDFSHSILFLRIEPLNQTHYTAQLTLKSRHLGKKGLASTGLPLLAQPIQLTISAELFEQVTAFQSVRRSIGTYFRKNESLTSESLRWEEQQLITSLFNTFFMGDILTVCRDFVELLEKNKIEELLLAISVDDTNIVNLPFEMVIPQFFPEKLGQTRQSLAVNHFGLVRTLEKALDQFEMQGKPASAAPLKMLFVTALPENMGEESKMLEIEDEQKRLIDAIGSFEVTGGEPKIVIEFLDTASLVEIKEALSKHKHDILHISGHGSYNPEVNQGVIHLEDEDGNHCQVLGRELGETLRQHQCVKLLILSACETAIAGNGVVEQLAAFGMSSIVAMRFSVTDMGAKIFTTALYAALSKAETLTQAIAQAREQLWVFVEQARKQNPNNQPLAEWFTPVVYLNQYTEALIPKDKYLLPEDFYPHSDFLKTRFTRLIGEGFIGRKRYLNQLRRHFANHQHVCLHGLGGMGKTTLAEAFAQNYDNHSHDVIIFRAGSQIAEKFILDEFFARLEADENANKNTVRQIKALLESNEDPHTKLQTLLDNYLKNRKTILIFDNFEDVQQTESGDQQYHIASKSLSDFLTYLCQHTPQNCHLLFTTRYKIVDLAEQLTFLALDKMTYAEQYRLTNFSETLRKIPMSERQDMLKRLDGHPRAYEFLETLLKTDKTLTWTNLATQIGTVEAQVWENLLLEKIYHHLSPAQQQLLQICAVFISRTPMAALEYVIGKAELKTDKLNIGNLLGLCFYEPELQTFEVHRLTREWLIRNIVDAEKLKQWAFLAGEYFKVNASLNNHELAKDYFEIAEKWEEFAKICFRLQTHYQLRGLYQRAFELNHAILEKDISGKFNADALNYCGTIMLSIGNNDTALKYFKKALAIRKQIGDYQGEGTTLNNLSAIAQSKGDYDTAIKYLEESLAMTQQIGNDKGEGTALNNLATIAQAKGDHNAALKYLEKSLSIRHRIGDTRGEGITLNNLATTAHTKGDYDTALKYLEKSLVIHQQIGDRKLEGTIFNNISQVYGSKGDYGTALKYLEKSLTIKQQIGDLQGEGVTLNNLATTAHTKGNYDIALVYSKQSLAIQQQIGDRKGEGATLNNISQIYDAKGDYDTALSYLEKSLAIQQQIGDLTGLAATLNNIGVIHINQKKNIENALPFFMQSYQILHKIGSPNSQYPANYLNAIIEKIGQQKFQEILSKLNKP